LRDKTWNTAVCFYSFAFLTRAIFSISWIIKKFIAKRHTLLPYNDVWATWNYRVAKPFVFHVALPLSTVLNCPDTYAVLVFLWIFLKFKYLVSLEYVSSAIYVFMVKKKLKVFFLAKLWSKKPRNLLVVIVQWKLMMIVALVPEILWWPFHLLVPQINSMLFKMWLHI